MSDMWMDLSTVKESRLETEVSLVRIAVAGLWPILAGANDRSDFINRLELLRPRIQSEASSDEVFRAVEASFINDFEDMLFQLRKEADVSQKTRDEAKAKGDTYHGTGKFPITDDKELKDAKDDIGRSKLPHKELVDYIDDRAKALGEPGVGKKSVYAERMEREGRAEVPFSKSARDPYLSNPHNREGIFHIDYDTPGPITAHCSVPNCGWFASTDDLPHLGADNLTDAFNDHVNQQLGRPLKNHRLVNASLHITAEEYPSVGEIPTGSLTDDELRNHLADHGLHSQPYRASNQRDHELDHLLDDDPTHTHGGQYPSYLDNPIQAVSAIGPFGHLIPDAEHTSGYNRYAGEYDGGLECADCDWVGTSQAARERHAKTHKKAPAKAASIETLTTTPAPTEAKKSFLSRLLRRANNDNNLLEKCPICGKEIPASEMANHMRKDHPHEAISVDDEDRQREHSKEKAKGKHEGSVSTQTPESNPLPPPPATPPTPHNVSEAPVQNAQMPANMINDPNPLNPTASLSLKARLDVIDKIALDLYYANPGLTQSERIHIATKTVDRYPHLVAEARGGADYIDGEPLVKCTQCGADTFSEASHHCHNCGFVSINN